MPLATAKIGCIMPSEDDDFRLALKLQRQINEEERSGKKTTDEREGKSSAKKPAETSVVPRSSQKKPTGVVDPYWELHDPNPDVVRLFREFNKAYFWGKLGGVEVTWSKRMTSSAGLCSYSRASGFCSIRLSEPLLQLRPRSDLVETLLHEMIHALLFVTQNNKDRTGHGEEFLKHAKRINKASGANITVYHDFHDEVQSYRIHKWRCDGDCRLRWPYYGYVRRAVNRAPSPRDLWWSQHERHCGGSFHKVAGPEPGKGKRKGAASLAGQKATKKGKVAESADIRSLLVPRNHIVATAPPAGPSGRGPKEQVADGSNRVQNSPGTATRLPSNVHTMTQPTPQAPPRMATFSGSGHTLGGSALRSRLVEESGAGPSSAPGTSASSSGTVGVRKGNPLPAASGTAAVVPGRSVETDWTRTGARPKSQKPSRSVQQTLTDLVGQMAPPATRVGRANGAAAKMKLLRELLDSDSDDDCVIVSATSFLGTTVHSGDASHSDQPSSSHSPMLVQCPICECFIEEKFINAHLDACLRPVNN